MSSITDKETRSSSVAFLQSMTGIRVRKLRYSALDFLKSTTARRLANRSRIAQCVRPKFFRKNACHKHSPGQDDQVAHLTVIEPEAETKISYAAKRLATSRGKQKANSVPPGEISVFKVYQEAIYVTARSLSGNALEVALTDFRQEYSGYEYLHLLEFPGQEIPAEDLEHFQAIQDAIDYVVEILPTEDAKTNLQNFRDEWSEYLYLDQLNWHESKLYLSEGDKSRILAECIDIVETYFPTK